MAPRLNIRLTAMRCGRGELRPGGPA